MLLFDQLDREWAWLLRRDPRPASLTGALAAAEASSLGELHGFVKQAPPDAADRVLIELARRAGTEDLAARVLLQLLLPGTRRLASRWWALGEPEERAAAAVTAVYGRIRRYPFERRPQWIAANVLLDAAHDLRRTAGRTLAFPAAGLPDSGPVVPVEPHPAEELATLLTDAVRFGVIARTDAQLVAATRIAGHRLADLAAARGTPLRTLQGRRRRAETALIAAGSAA